MISRLYIVGNGFDLYHNIPSSYQDFGRYFLTRDKGAFRRLERYFDFDERFWNEFEERLASFDVDTLIQDAESALTGYGSDGWRDSANHDYQFEITESLQAVSTIMRGRFAEWIRQLPIPEPSAVPNPLRHLDLSGTFLNFNYTPSLQKLYNVPEDNIVFIHGSAAQPTAQLILGHGWKRTESDSLNYRIDRESADFRVIEGNMLIDKYFTETFKPTATIVADHEPFFASLVGAQEIFVMGHSLAEVDHPYFTEIINRVDLRSARWKVSYYSKPDYARMQMATLGVPSPMIEFATLSEF